MGNLKTAIREENIGLQITYLIVNPYVPAGATYNVENDRARNSFSRSFYRTDFSHFDY